MSAEYIVTFTSEETEVAHLDGVPWHEARKPRRWHKCWAQTKGTMNYFTEVERCACGAIRRPPDGRWFERNSR